MENRSTHYGDVAKWIEKVIDSCETYQQTFAANRLIRNFGNQLNRKMGNLYYGEIIKPLQQRLHSKEKKLINL